MPQQLSSPVKYSRPPIAIAEPVSIKGTDGLCKLPSLRPVALKILKVLSRDDVRLEQIAALLQADPGFSAEVLTMANSAAFAASQPFGDLSKAILFLGLDRIRSLTMTIAMRSFSSRKQDSVEIRNSWRHSLACAFLAEEFATIYGASKHSAYTAGLLHDVGRLGLLKAYSGQYGQVLNQVYETLAEAHEKERKLFNMDHCQAGSWLTKTWGFPEEFSEIAARHHDCPEGRERDMIGLIQTACRMADALGFGAVQYRQIMAPADVIAATPLDWQRRFPSQWDELRARVGAKLEALDSLGG
ncbi:MAG: HDOD domain-containing protein [Acidobacteriota bacterium]|nr:HDOD domain-containing protein [Acidobacteriota bacterium]